MSPPLRPKQNTLDKDIEAYHQQQQKFLISEEQFKNGYAVAGITAINLLSSMYRVLVAPYHVPSNEEKAKEFMGEMRDLKEQISEFVKKNESNEHVQEGSIGKNYYGLKAFRDLEPKFDELVLKFYKIKSEVGLT